MFDDTVAPNDQLPIYLEVPKAILKTDRISLWLEPLRIYRTGIELTILMSIRGSEASMNYLGGYVHPHTQPVFKIAFHNADGSSIDNTIDSATIQPHDGGGSLTCSSSAATDDGARAVYYLNRLPATGPLTLSVSSEQHGIQNVSIDLDSTKISNIALTVGNIW